MAADETRGEPNLENLPGLYSSSQRNMTRLDVSLNFQLNVRRLVVARSVRKSHSTDLQAVIAKQLAKYLQIRKLVSVRSKKLTDVVFLQLKLHPV